MQRYKILHRTYYNFTDTVKLGPHYLRLRPREDHELHVESFSLNVNPSARFHWRRDVEGNSLAVASFNSRVKQLSIESEVLIQQHNEAPLDFLVDEYAVNFPFAYLSFNEKILLSPYMDPPNPETQTLLKQWITAFWQPGEPIQTYSLLQRLTSYINHNLSYQIREEPGVQTARQTLAIQSGSCRDFAVLFLETARCVGLASRFVSGYLHSAPSATNFGATHAWAEVYLPGAGWKCFDPTIGDIVGSDHIPVAVARLPDSVPPIAGSYFGNAESSLDVGVWLTKV